VQYLFLREEPKPIPKSIGKEFLGRASVFYQNTLLPNYLNYAGNIDEMIFLPPTMAIKRAIKENYQLFLIIWGPKGFGKSELGLWLCYDYFGDWEKVKECVNFTLEQFISLSDGPKRDIVLWDDMAVHFGKYTSQFRMTARNFFEYFDAIRVKNPVIIGTVVNPNKLPKSIREDYNAEIYVPKRGMCNYYTFETRPDFYRRGEVFLKRWLVGSFYLPTGVPDDVRNWYTEQRIKLLELKEVKLLDSLIDENAKILKNMGEVERLTLTILYEGENTDAKLEILRRTYESKEVKLSFRRLESYGLIKENLKGSFMLTAYGKKFLLGVKESERKRVKKI
jgi:hypothetical protein